MAQVPADARLEVKFVTRVSEIRRIESWLRMHPACFSEPYPDRSVNNVYFDTLQLSAYTDNISGSSYRTKLRYRWYGDAEFPDNGNLEIKYKRNYFGWKRRFKCDRRLFSAGDRWKDFRLALGKYLGDEARLWLESWPNPVMLNRYYRQYYVSGDNKVRVTIDSNQRVYDQRYKSVPNIDQKANSPDTLVIEFKFDRKDRDLAAEIIQGLPIRVSRNSKYVVGVRSML
jgi:SPX domain protein involved in polyphosphate accumulation